jgi:excisionase family DNA binding protein
MQLSWTIDQVRERTGLGRSSLYVLMASGQLKSTMIGRRRLILAKSLEELLARGTVSLSKPSGAGGQPGLTHSEAAERGRKGARAQRAVRKE